MIRAGIVGFGWWGRTILETLSASRRIQVVAVTDVAPAQVKPECARLGLTWHDTLDAMIADSLLDVVILTSPHRFHEEQIVASAHGGKHVFCEKPLALTLDAAARAVAACIRNGVRLGVGHERRFEPPMEMVGNLLEEGEFGQLVQIEANFSHDKLCALEDDNWRLSRAESGCGPMTATGIHLLDMSIRLGGRAVTAYASNRSLTTRFESGDTMAAHITLESGVVASINAMLAVPFYARFTLFGSKGWIEVNDRSHVEAPSCWIVRRCSSTGVQTHEEFPPARPVLKNFESFCDAIEGSQTDYAIPLQQMLDTVAGMEAVFISTLQGSPVPVRQIVAGSLVAPPL